MNVKRVAYETRTGREAELEAMLNLDMGEYIDQ